MTVINVDVVCGLAWGDEAKGKIVSELLKKISINGLLDGVVVVMLDILFTLILKNMSPI